MNHADLRSIGMTFANQRARRLLSSKSTSKGNLNEMAVLTRNDDAYSNNILSIDLVGQSKSKKNIVSAHNAIFAPACASGC